MMELTAQTVEELAHTDLAQACERARELVAANPGDEGAARLLHELIQRFAREWSTPPTAPERDVAPVVAEASRLLAAGQDEQSELLLRRYLAQWPDDTAAMRLMADIAVRCGFPDNAERILRRALEIEPNCASLWVALAKTLHRSVDVKGHAESVEGALAALDKAVDIDSGHEIALSFKASVLVQLRRLEAGRATFATLAMAHPHGSRTWMNYAFLLKTLGRFGESVAAYRTSVAIDPANGGGWWGLANLKLAKFFAGDIERMEMALANGGLEDMGLVELHFAMAKAYDGRREFAAAARHLELGNSLRRKLHPDDPDLITRDVDDAKKVYTAQFFSRRRGWGDKRSDPIFIVGMPRSGSTLLEQILSSHSQVEGTEELFIIQTIAAELAKAGKERRPERALTRMMEPGFAALGQRYLQLAAPYRKTARPRFTDKNPQNWRHVGLIHSALPNARIIDMRRNPLDCLFANYAQHFNLGVNYSYAQTSLARFFSDYVRLMRHFDAILPGHVHRIIHDDLVENLECEVRRLLDYLGLPFEESCLRFFETDRAVHTPSSEQVRQPINREGIGRWKNYEPWLGELSEGLGDLLTNWRN